MKTIEAHFKVLDKYISTGLFGRRKYYITVEGISPEISFNPRRRDEKITVDQYYETSIGDTLIVTMYESEDGRVRLHP